MATNIHLLPDQLALWNNLSAFVYEACEGNHPCVGYDYAHKIATRSVSISVEMYGHNTNSNQFIKTVMIVAWLQDVYNELNTEPDDGLKRMLLRLLEQLVPDQNYRDNILAIMDHISLEKEWLNYHTGVITDWVSLLGEQGSLVRSVVSDAVNLESLTDTGIKRCFMYARRYFNNISEADLKSKVLTHIKNKLLHIKDSFMHTPPGRRDVILLHNQLLTNVRLDKINKA